MAAMTGRADSDTAVLSCHPAATAAQRFYQAQGWQTLTTQFRTRPGQPGYWVMGLRLTPG